MSRPDARSSDDSGQSRLRFHEWSHARSRQIVDTKHDARDAVVMRRPVERINDVRKPRILFKGILPEHGQHERRLCRTALLHFSDQVNAKKRSLGQVRASEATQKTTAA
mgnify:CR=1 FL=1